MTWQETFARCFTSLPLAPTGGELRFNMTNYAWDNSYIIDYKKELPQKRAALKRWCEYLTSEAFSYHL